MEDPIPIFVVDEGRINILYSCSHVTTIPFSIDRDWHDRKDNSTSNLIELVNYSYWSSKIALDVERSIKRKSSNLTIIGFQIQVHVQYVMVIHSSVQNNPEMLPRLLGMILKQMQCQGQALFSFFWIDEQKIRFYLREDLKT